MHGSLFCFLIDSCLNLESCWLKSVKNIVGLNLDIDVCVFKFYNLISLPEIFIPRGMLFY